MVHARRCPPGVFCIENISFTLLAIIFTGVVVYFMKGPHHSQQQQQPYQPQHMQQSQHPSMFQTRANYGVSNAQEDVLLNPYVPPLRNDLPSQDLRGPVMPINISTMQVKKTATGVVHAIHSSICKAPVWRHTRPMAKPLAM